MYRAAFDRMAVARGLVAGRRFAMRYVVAAFAALNLACNSGSAATVDVQTINTADGALTTIAIEGELVPGDETKFADAAIRAPSAVVMLNSPGGREIVGIEIGQAIRHKGFATYVPDGFTCASACALAWVAGGPRFMSAGSDRDDEQGESPTK